MPVYDGCDDPTIWTVTGATVLTADATDYIMAPASLRAETPTGQWWCFLTKWHWFQDWSRYPIVTFWVKVSRIDKPISLMIATEELILEHHYPFTLTAIDTWQKFTIDLRKPSVEGRIPDLTRLRCFRIDWELQNAGGILHLDQIEFSEYAITPGKGILECHAYVNTEEVKATVEVVGVGTYLTPFFLELDPGTYTIELTYLGVKKTYSTTVTEGQTVRVDAQFAMPTPIPLKPFIVIVAPLLTGLALYGLSKTK